MLAFSDETPIFVHGGGVDLRNGFEGLAGAVFNSFGSEAQTDAYYLFLNQRRTRAKVLFLSETKPSLWYVHSRLRTFSHRHVRQGRITAEEFQLIIEGKVPPYLLSPEKPF